MRKGVRLTASLLMSTLCGCQLSFHAGSDVAVSELMDEKIAQIDTYIKGLQR